MTSSMTQDNQAVWRIMPLGLGLGLLGNLLLRIPTVGVNLTLWLLALILVLAFRWPRASGGEPPSGRLLLWSFGAFTLVFSWRSAETLQSFNVLTGFVLLAWAIARRRGTPLRLGGVVTQIYRLARWGAEVALGGVPLLIRGGGWPRLVMTSGWQRASRVLVGVVIALPLLLIFGGLLTSADLAFRGWVQDLVRIDFAKVRSHAVLTTFFAWVAWGVLGSLLPERGRHADSVNLPRTVRLGPIETGVALGLVDLLFLAFVVFQVRYLFGGHELIEATVGLTYAEYARNGFFELVAVVALAVPVLLVADWLLTDADRKVYRGLAGLTVIMLGVMLASAAWRMRLYQQAYGWTELRFYVNAFMIWLAAVLLWFSATVLPGKREHFTFGAMVAGMALVLGLNAANPQAWVAERNLARAVAGEPLDLAYLRELGPDAVARMTDFVPLLPRELAASLRALLEEQAANQPEDWRGWTWSRHAARQAMRDLRAP